MCYTNVILNFGRLNLVLLLLLPLFVRPKVEKATADSPGGQFHQL